MTEIEIKIPDGCKLIGTRTEGNKVYISYEDGPKSIGFKALYDKYSSDDIIESEEE